MATPSSRRTRSSAAAAVVLLTATMLTACAGEPGTAGSPGWTISGSTATRTASPGPDATDAASASPSATPKTAALPTDCREILTEAVIDAMGETPLNDPAFGPSGVQSDGSLICTWRDPRADTTGLSTTISRMARGPALDMLNQLADTEGFTCYTPDDGTRCEKTWENATYPVTDGRTLFWRDDLLIDTMYSNFAPPGYTAAMVEKIFG